MLHVVTVWTRGVLFYHRPIKYSCWCIICAHCRHILNASFTIKCSVCTATDRFTKITRSKRTLKITLRELWLQEVQLWRGKGESRGEMWWDETVSRDDLQGKGRKYDGEEIKRDWQRMRRCFKVGGRSKKSERSVSDRRSPSITETAGRTRPLYMCRNAGPEEAPSHLTLLLRDYIKDSHVCSVKWFFIHVDYLILT